MSGKIQDTQALQLNVDIWLKRLVRYWWIIVSVLILSVGFGQTYLRYTNSEYMAKAKILIKGASKGSSISELGILSDQLGISNGSKTLDNEIQILSSRPILKEVVERIGADVTYIRKGNLKDTEMYRRTPFLIAEYELPNPDKAVQFHIGLVFDHEFTFSLEEDQEGKLYKMGDWVETNQGRFKIVRNENVRHYPGDYVVKIVNPVRLAGRFKQKLLIEIVGSQYSSGILELSLQDKSPQKAEDFISTLIDVYDQAEVEDNIAVMVSTIDFLNKRITDLNQDLNVIEGDIEKYKSQNELISDDVSSSLDFVLRELRTAIGAESSFKLEQAMLKSLYNDLTEERETEFLIPVNVASADPALAGLINDYNEAYLQRKRLKNTITTESPTLSNLDSRMTDIKQLIISSLSNLIEELEIPLLEKRKEISALQEDISVIPNVQKELVEKLRMQTIKEDLFLFLLQKKEETELSRAVYKSNTRIVEPALTGGAVYPRKKLVLMGSIILGLIIPIGFISILALLETKIETEDDIKYITDIPILARIPRENIVLDVQDFLDSKSVSLESFRLLRTNLNYLNIDQNRLVTLITSSMAGEGKTSIAIKLASVIALSGKKVVLIDLDLRKPKIAAYLEMESSPGISNYLAGHVESDGLIRSVSGIPNLSIIPSGNVPPNPAELILSDKLLGLIDSLKKDFDHVILDSPPAGVVADALQLRKFVTQTLCIVRSNYTKKIALKFIEEMNEQAQLIKPHIVINDVKSGSNYGGYSSKYGGGYYNSES